MQELQVLEQGTVTTPRGFTAGAVHVGVRSDWEKLDVGILASDVPCAAAAASTRNRVPGASLVIRTPRASGLPRAPA